MKQLLQQLAYYNIWANRLLLDAVKKVPEEYYQKEVASSFPSLLKTVLHMWNAQSVWWQRMKLQERITRTE